MKIFRFIIIFFATLLVAFLLHLLVYKTVFSYENASNVLFVVGIILFLPTMVAITRAYEVFQGIKYVFRVLLSPSFRDQYPRFKEYRDDNSSNIKSTIFREVFLASLIVIIISIVLAGVAMR